MKTTIIALALLCSLPAGASKKGDVASDANPEAQAQIRKRLDEIWNNFVTKDVARQESFHLYGPKFTEFKDGQPRGDAEANKKEENEVIQAITDPKVEMKIWRSLSTETQRLRRSTASSPGSSAASPPR